MATEEAAEGSFESCSTARISQLSLVCYSLSRCGGHHLETIFFHNTFVDAIYDVEVDGLEDIQRPRLPV